MSKLSKLDNQIKILTDQFNTCIKVKTHKTTKWTEPKLALNYKKIHT